MDNTYPLMMYRAGGSEPIHGGHFATLIVGNADEQAAAIGDGWFLTTDEAAEADKQAKAKVLAEAEARSIAAAQALVDANAQPTRAELEQKATELGLPFDGRTSERKLRDMIAAAIE